MWPFTRGREKRETRILLEFLSTTEELSAFDLHHKTNIPLLALFPALRRMVDDGRLTSRVPESTENRGWMRRRLYRMASSADG